MFLHESDTVTKHPPRRFLQLCFRIQRVSVPFTVSSSECPLQDRLLPRQQVSGYVTLLSSSATLSLAVRSCNLSSELHRTFLLLLTK